MSDEECTSMERSGLRGQVGAVDSAVAVKRMSGWRIRRLVEEVIVTVEEGGGADVYEWDWGLGCKGREVNVPMMLIVSLVRISV